MDIHKPKPWHGLREFLKEYVIIVVGVLTALGAEAGVEWLHWRHQVELAHHQLAFDMKRAMAWAGEEDATSPCRGARLEDIDRILIAGQNTGRLAAIGVLPDNHPRTWNMRSWSSLTYGQTLSHMSLKEQTSLVAVQLSVDAERQNTAEFDAEWVALQGLAGPARPVSGEELVRLRTLLKSARRHAFLLRLVAARIPTYVAQSGLLTAREREAAWRQGVDAIGASGAYGLCRPLPLTFEPSMDSYATYLAAPPTTPGTARTDTVGIQGESLK